MTYLSDKPLRNLLRLLDLLLKGIKIFENLQTFLACYFDHVRILCEFGLVWLIVRPSRVNKVSESSTGLLQLGHHLVVLDLELAGVRTSLCNRRCLARRRIVAPFV